MVDYKERSRLVNQIFLLANVLVTSNFLMFRFASEPSRLTLEVTIFSWVVYIAVLIAVNIWLYNVYLKKPQNQASSVSS
jgi:hypothetical protein